MKYIRTKDGKIIDTRGALDSQPTNRNLMRFKSPNWYHNGYKQITIKMDNVIKQADTIEKLCDEKVAIRKSNHTPCLGHFSGPYFFQEDSGWLGRVDSYEKIYCAIWTKGKHDELILKSVAKMKGVLPNGEIDWELL